MFYHMTNLETELFQILIREAARCCSSRRTAFSGPARANAYGPHTGLSSLVLQRKGSQGRAGHTDKWKTIKVYCKWFEPRSTTSLSSVIVWSRLLKSEKKNLCCFDNLRGSHLQSHFCSGDFRSD